MNLEKTEESHPEHNHKLFVVIRANILHHWSSRLLLKFKLHEIQRTWEIFLCFFRATNTMIGESWDDDEVATESDDERKEAESKSCHVAPPYRCQEGTSLSAKEAEGKEKMFQEHYGLKIMIFFKIYYLLCCHFLLLEDLWFELYSLPLRSHIRVKIQIFQHNSSAVGRWVLVDFPLVMACPYDWLISISIHQSYDRHWKSFILSPLKKKW